ncbi:MAG: hypothetical protein MRZ79_26980 [Bacteroidia bacterium]|nr:hypothetical protein [Bacteroidia bacterium]
MKNLGQYKVFFSREIPTLREILDKYEIQVPLLKKIYIEQLDISSKNYKKLAISTSDIYELWPGDMQNQESTYRFLIKVEKITHMEIYPAPDAVLIDFPLRAMYFIDSMVKTLIQLGGELDFYDGDEEIATSRILALKPYNEYHFLKKFLLRHIG